MFVDQIQKLKDLDRAVIKITDGITRQLTDSVTEDQFMTVKHGNTLKIHHTTINASYSFDFRIKLESSKVTEAELRSLTISEMKGSSFEKTEYFEENTLPLNRSKAFVIARAMLDKLLSSDVSIDQEKATGCHWQKRRTDNNENALVLKAKKPGGSYRQTLLDIRETETTITR